MNPQVVEFIRTAVLLIWSYDGVKVIVCHTLINVVFAVAAAHFNREVSLSRLGEFLYRKLLPYTLSYFAVKILGEGAGVAYLAAPIWVIIEASLTGDLADNWVRLGLPLPDRLKALVVKE
jgi:hypothetical protein